MNITLIIPIYNEVQAINSIIDRVIKFLNDRNNFDCILVNDGSIDGTEKFLSKLHHNKIQVLHKKNGGYGSAIKFASKYVKSNFFAIIDADGTYPLEKFDEMCLNLESYNMVVGSRTSSNSSIPIIKKIPKFFIKLFSSYVTMKEIPDFNSGMRIFRTSTFRKFLYFLPDGFSLTTTMTIILSSFNYNIKYVEIDYFERVGDSKIRPFKDTINFFVTVAKLGIYFKPFRIYGPLIIFFFGVGALFLIYRFLVGEGFLVLTILSFMIAMFLLVFCFISSSISQLIFMQIDKDKDD